MTNIQWTDKTWNVIIGCSKAKGSPGCANCYAINQAYRNSAIAQQLITDGKNAGRLAYYEGLTEKRGNRVDWTGKEVTLILASSNMGRRCETS